MRVQFVFALSICAVTESARLLSSAEAPRQKSTQWLCARDPQALGCPYDVPDFQWTTDQIVLNKSSSMDFGRGKKLETRFYRNLAYPTGVPDQKGVHGFYTFLVVWMANGKSDSDAMPLWVFEHGGGAGYFEEDGTYKGSCSPRDATGEHCQTQYTYNVEEGYQKMLANLHWSIDGYFKGPVTLYNSTLDRRLSEGYRLMLVSYSDHDGYTGYGQPYDNNPYGGTVKGLLASWSAVDYTLAHYNTSKYFLHGCSAGSLGVASLAFSMALKDYSPLPRGVVSDSWMFTNRITEYYYQLRRDEAFKQHPDWDAYNASRKFGWFGKTMDNNNAAENYIRAGMPVPVMWVYGQRDPACGGINPLIQGAIDAGVGNCEYNYGLMLRALNATPGTPHSVKAVIDGPHCATIMTGRKMYRQAVDFVEDFIRDK